MKAPNITKGSWQWNEHLHWLFRDEPEQGFSETILTTAPNFAPSPADAKMLSAAPLLAEALHEAYERYVCRCGYKGCAHCAYSRKVEEALQAAGYTEE